MIRRWCAGRSLWDAAEDGFGEVVVSDEEREELIRAEEEARPELPSRVTRVG